MADLSKVIVTDDNRQGIINSFKQFFESEDFDNIKDNGRNAEELSNDVFDKLVTELSKNFKDLEGDKEVKKKSDKEKKKHKQHKHHDEKSDNEKEENEGEEEVDEKPAKKKKKKGSKNSESEEEKPAKSNKKLKSH